MSDHKIRNHLRQALDEAIKATAAEETKAIEENIRLAANIEKMKPLVKLLDALQDELGEVRGLAIIPYANGDGVAITTEIYPDWLYGYKPDLKPLKATKCWRPFVTRSVFAITLLELA